MYRNGNFYIMRCKNEIGAVLNIRVYREYIQKVLEF